MTDKQDQEADWRSEFDRDGELLVYDNFTHRIYNDSRKRRAAVSWLTNEASKRRTREFRMVQLAMWALVIAVAAAVVGGTGIVLALLYH